MRTLIVTVLIAALMSCARPEDAPESQDRASKQAQRPAHGLEAETPADTAQDRARYGLGAPWPEAVPDSGWNIITNEVVLKFQDEVELERALFLVDSLSRVWQAAARKADVGAFVFCKIRWPAERRLHADSVARELELLPDVDFARPEILLRPGGEADTVFHSSMTANRNRFLAERSMGGASSDPA